ncbi:MULTISPECIES: sigma-70 family RNA polymerase sigma factor [unclassified Sporosarcina]|uniref:sigma-70 family RNA polymerase sigma factor n=1 Tax=unclassified Sporosarcina TaxID=2647733 RepID=UPI00203E0DB3|nr:MULTISPECIES: sigma-70 family RNA polymerase sigma factor [unclassified Sporosarcina]GKV64342.1 DNA-directed RNA polymerase sigma-70 factor [Sporosarcina sp. NCCP-2331]GLB55087.1 DNA-directed RNA polymerase sigma-70 factor [Sporosarcina sp. NCCP-2378]
MKSTERNFIRRLKRKKEDAVEYIVDAYLPVVKAVVYKVLGPLQKDADIEECISDVFLAVWENSDQFEGEAEDFKKWICMVAKYKAIDQYRRMEKRNNREQGMDDMYFISDSNAAGELLAKEEQEELLMAMSKLNEMDRDIFTMKYFLDMSNGEIAESLRVTKAAVDNRLYRGKKQLSILMKSEWGGECI